MYLVTLLGGLVSSTVAAWWGAGLSTVVAVVHVLNYARDRANVTLNVRRDMKTTDPRHAGMTLVIFSATNSGRRPVTITGFGVRHLFGKEEMSNAMFTDIHPPLPCEITEGKYAVAYVNQAGFDFKSVAFWYAYSSTGRVFRLNIAPWYQRWMSEFRWKKVLPTTKRP